ncbi:alpha/beta fold hydrolase [Corynebacterium halotolerans]|uniref:Proline iminopeptidase n=1 Tax=Corynebacterium halotolerans YIM 70093 = DSM 44683 TaxID=1121362 RepID=M1P8Z1_9CORY|nr:alpha/beta fold hydrolase [Corynebacterium halotolerans]AGF73141.1 proline iminopeptidase [Corynebacterium halotolerans YIM 70093 = DSM 44683]
MEPGHTPVDLQTTTRRAFGLSVREHTMTVPWDWHNPGGTLEVFARELAAEDAGPDTPVLLFLQGGPGNPAPRPVELGGWLGEALRHHRILLLDQRGTGRSTRLDRHADETLLDAAHLSLLRADSIVADAEALRAGLGVDRWDVLGQSFGGFCITTYLSRHPESIRYAYFTGGLPAIDVHADEVYRATFARLAARHEAFYRTVPWAERRIREICHHLNNSDERLPTGERLSSRRFRTIGIELGRATGFHSLAHLLDAPFHDVRGEKRLRGDTLAELGQRLSFEANPLYAVVHESIYGGSTPGPTAWAANCVREEVEGFEENLDPVRDEKFHLTGEHIFPWQFEEDPALVPFRRVAEDLAQREWPRLYDEASLAGAPATGAAAVYVDDIYVPMEHSLATAARIRDLRPWITNEHQHDGLRADGENIFRRLHAMVRG